MATAATRNDQAVFAFAREVKNLTRLGVDGTGTTQAYVPYDALKRYWTSHKINQSVGVWFLSAESIANDYLRVLSTLASANRLHCLEEFMHYGLRDELLPLVGYPSDWPKEKIFQELYDDFTEHQWRFFPLVFTRHRLENLHVHPRQVLPLREMKPIHDVDKYETAILYKIQIEEGYNGLSDVCSRGTPIPPFTLPRS
jgi:hypothetical protein